jgi:hypothetical protein
MPRQNPSKRIIIHDLLDVQIRLSELDLTIQDLHHAVAMGQAVRRQCTDNDPAAAVGIATWGRTVRGLREALSVRGWERCDDDNLETVVSPERGMAIAVATGDGATGDPARTPKTKHQRGAATADAVDRNNDQRSIFELIPGYAPEALAAEIERSRANRVTYVLLISAHVDEVRCELSSPDGIGEDARVESWSERIILPAFRFEPGARADADEDDTPEIDVVVTRKRG